MGEIIRFIAAGYLASAAHYYTKSFFNADTVNGFYGGGILAIIVGLGTFYWLMISHYIRRDMST